MANDCESKEFLILHILNDEDNEQPLSVKKKTCYADLPIEYNEIYVPIKFSELLQQEPLLIEQIKKLSQDCDGLLIKMPFLIFALDFLKKLTFPLYTCIYIDEILSDEIIFEIHKKFPTVKIYNVKEIDISLQSSFVQTDYFSKKITEYYSELNYFKKDEAVKDLECAPWFQNFIERSFFCVYGRLRQLSGTCYLNSVLNGLFLTPTTRLLLKEKYEEIKDLIKVDDVTFDTLACPMPSTKNSLPYLMALTNLFIVKKEKFTAGSNLLKEMSKQMFSLDKYEGEGGLYLFTFGLILQNLGYSFSYVVDNKNYNIVLDKQARSFTFSGQTDPQEAKDFVILNITKAGDKISKIQKFNNESYILMFAFIRLSFVFGQAHAMVGIFCNGRPQIYDSENIINDYDWLEYNVDKMKKIYAYTQDLTIDYIYIKKSLFDLLHSTPQPIQEEKENFSALQEYKGKNVMDIIEKLSSGLPNRCENDLPAFEPEMLTVLNTMIEQEHFWEARCIFLKMLKRYELSFQEIYKHPDNPELAEDFKENFTVQNVTDGQDFYYKFSLKQKENGNILAIGKFGKSKKGELAIRSALACGLVLNDLHERYQLSNFLYTYGGLTWQQEEYTRTMVLFQYINGGTSFDDLLSAGMLSTKDIRGVLVQLAYAIGKAYSVCAFLHGNINCKNIIIQTLKEPVVVRNEAFVLKIRYIPIISGFGLNSSFSWGNASYNVKFIANPIADELKPVFERMSEVFPSNRNLFLKLMGCSDAEIFSIIFQM